MRFPNVGMEDTNIERMSCSDLVIMSGSENWRGRGTQLNRRSISAGAIGFQFIVATSQLCSGLS